VDCCDVGSVATPEAVIKDCPSCGERGRLVKPITLISLLPGGPPAPAERYRFCGTVGCDVAWFSQDTGHVVSTSQVPLRIGQKESAPDRALCYCFGYTAADMTTDVARTGTSGIPDVITEHCRRGEDRCPETNPQGACCLGNVRAALEDALANNLETLSCACG